MNLQLKLEDVFKPAEPEELAQRELEAAIPKRAYLDKLGKAIVAKFGGKYSFYANKTNPAISADTDIGDFGIHTDTHGDQVTMTWMRGIEPVSTADSRWYTATNKGIPNYERGQRGIGWVNAGQTDAEDKLDTEEILSKIYSIMHLRVPPPAFKDRTRMRISEDIFTPADDKELDRRANEHPVWAFGNKLAAKLKTMGYIATVGAPGYWESGSENEYTKSTLLIDRWNLWQGGGYINQKVQSTTERLGYIDIWTTDNVSIREPGPERWVVKFRRYGEAYRWSNNAPAGASAITLYSKTSAPDVDEIAKTFHKMGLLDEDLFKPAEPEELNKRRKDDPRVKCSVCGDIGVGPYAIAQGKCSYCNRKKIKEDIFKPASDKDVLARRGFQKGDDIKIRNVMETDRALALQADEKDPDWRSSLSEKEFDAYFIPKIAERAGVTEDFVRNVFKAISTMVEDMDDNDFQSFADEKDNAANEWIDSVVAYCMSISEDIFKPATPKEIEHREEVMPKEYDIYIGDSWHDRVKDKERAIEIAKKYGNGRVYEISDKDMFYKSQVKCIYPENDWRSSMNEEFKGVEDLRKGFFDRLVDEIEDRIDKDEETDEDYVALAAIRKMSEMGVDKGLKALTPEEGEVMLRLYQADVGRHGRYEKDVSTVMGLPAGATRKIASRAMLKARKEVNKPDRKNKLKDIAKEIGSDKAVVDPWDVDAIFPDTDDTSSAVRRYHRPDIYEDFKKLVGEDVFKPAEKSDVKARKKIGVNLQQVQWMKDVFGKRIPGSQLTEVPGPDNRFSMTLNGKPTGIEVVIGKETRQGTDMYVYVDGKKLPPIYADRGGAAEFDITGMAEPCKHINRVLRKKGLK